LCQSALKVNLIGAHDFSDTQHPAGEFFATSDIGKKYFRESL